jgi:arylsulfatase A-like enzyme
VSRRAGRAVLLAALVSLVAARAGGAAPVSQAGDLPPSTPPPASETQPVRRGIVLMTVDSLRVDRLGCYAGADRHSPGMDSVARAGVRFDRAYTAAVTSAASVASLMTGLDPPGHGLRGTYNDHLDAGVPTLAERLRAAGWATAAVIGTERLDSKRGLGRGFDRYDEDIAGIRKRLGVMSKERRASEVAERGLVALEALPKDRPFFLWLHFHDPEYDYDAPDPQKQAHPDSPYDAEVAAVDSAVDTLVKTLREKVPRGRLTLVLAGTYGEGLGDHQEVGHGFYLNETTVRVPLLVAPEGPASAAGRTEPSPVALVDLAPTLLAIAGAPALERTDGRVLDAIAQPPAPGAAAKKGRGGRDSAPRRIYFEAAAPYLEYGWSPLAGIIEGDRKVVAAPGGRVEAFDLAADASGSSPLPKAPRWAADLGREAVKRLGSLDPPEERRREVAVATEGYAFPWGNSPFCAEKIDFPDPRDPDRVALAAKLYPARFDFDLGYTGNSGDVALKVQDQDPANPAVLEMIAAFGLRAHWGDLLLEPLETLTCGFPYRIQGYHYLGHYYSSEKRDMPKALAAFRLMAAADPLEEEAEYDIACTYAAMGQKDEAFEHLRRSIELGAHEWTFMRRDPRLNPLRTDPRLDELVPVPSG